MKNLLCGLFLFSITSAFSQYAAPSLTHLKYDEGENSWLNVYLAESKSPTPVLVWAHANGKDPSANDFPNSLWQELKQGGVSVISWESIPNIASAGHIIIGEEDFLKVMEWIKTNASKYNLDVNKIIISGRSRGSIISFPGTNQLFKEIKGAYFVQALPKGGWMGKDFRNDVTVNSPKLVLAYADSPDTKDGHTPLNGMKIEARYDSLGIGDRINIYHSLGKDNLYKYLLSFIIENTK